MTLLLQTTPRFLFYALFFLMPIFWVPGLSLPLVLHKQLLLAIVVSAAGALWIIDILRKGEVSFRWHILFVPLGLFVLFAFISTLGSGAFIHSFWGANAEPDSFFNILLFALLFVLITNKLAKRAYVTHAVGFFVAGAALGAILLFISSLAAFAFPFGSAFAFSIYAGGAFLLALLFALNATKGTYGAYLTYAAAAILFLVVLFTSQWVAWAGIAVGSLLLIYFLIKYQHLSPEASAKGDKSAVISINQRLILPLITFALSLLFLFVSNPLSNVLSIAPEVRLGGSATIDIAKDTVFSGVKNALFGSGPATFYNQYNLHRGPEINNTPFWNLRFENGTGAITSFFATVGILGGGAIVVFLLWFLWFCMRFLMTRINADNGRINADSPQGDIGINQQYQHQSAANAVLIGGIYFLIAWLLYSTNFMLLFAGFLFVALWAALRGRQEKIVFSQSSALMFWGMAGSVAVLVAFIFGGYALSRVYAAEVSYARGVELFEKKDFTSAMIAFQKAIQNNSSDFDKYWRKLSAAILSQTIAIFSDPNMPEQKKTESVQKGILGAEGAAKEAVRINSKNSTNFEWFGDVYLKVAPRVVDESLNLPIVYYEQAYALNPQSPLLFLKKARAHLEIVKRLDERIASSQAQVDAPQLAELSQARAQSLASARSEAENALKLKGDFGEALDFLASLPLGR